MSNKVLITGMELGEGACKAPFLVCCYYKDENLYDLSINPLDQENRIGRVYVGRVSEIVPQINAAFIKISNDEKCFFNLDELPSLIFTKKNGKDGINVGDEVLVQISQERLKTKDPTVKAKIELIGQFSIATSDKKENGLSKKLSKERKEELKALLDQAKSSHNEIGFLIRTNAETTDNSLIEKELNKLANELETILSKAPHMTLYQSMYQPEADYISFIRSISLNELDEIVTDNIDIYNNISFCLSDTINDNLINLRLYEDDYSLINLYSLKTRFNEITNRKVWLKSGAYLIIDQTEAMTVIDVNSGKNIKRKDPDYILNINLEASREIARQLRLRNLSGIILVDYIDLKNEKDKQILINKMRELVKKDHITTSVIDFTKLNLMELTRKKTKASIKQQITGKIMLDDQ